MGSQLEGFAVGVGGFRMAAHAGQRVAHHPKAAGVSHTKGARSLGELVGGGKVTAAQRRQDGGIAQCHMVRLGGDACQERGQSRIDIAGRFLCRGKRLMVGGIGGFDGQRLADTRCGVLWSPDFQQQHTKQGLRRRV